MCKLRSELRFQYSKGSVGVEISFLTFELFSLSYFELVALFNFCKDEFMKFATQTLYFFLYPQVECILNSERVNY
jgi:hypothetical protein